MNTQTVNNQQITSLSGEPIRLVSQLVANVNSWTGGKLRDNYYKTIQGLVLLNGEEVEIYRHWSHPELPISIIEAKGGGIGTIEFTNWRPMVDEEGEGYLEADIIIHILEAATA